VTEQRNLNDPVWITADIVISLVCWADVEALIRSKRGGRVAVLSVNPVPADLDAEPTLRLRPRP
jgi:hypothetical protein